MNCPLCNKKLMVDMDQYNPGFADYICFSEITPDPPGTRSESHYTKKSISDYSGSFGRIIYYYVEEAIVMPFRIRNYYCNTDFKKPHCIIDKYTMEKGRKPLFYFKQIITLPSIVPVLPYKKMQARLKNIVLFS